MHRVVRKHCNMERSNRSAASRAALGVRTLFRTKNISQELVQTPRVGKRALEIMSKSLSRRSTGEHKMPMRALASARAGKVRVQRGAQVLTRPDGYSSPKLLCSRIEVSHLRVLSSSAPSKMTASLTQYCTRFTTPRCRKLKSLDSPGSS